MQLTVMEPGGARKLGIGEVRIVEKSTVRENSRAAEPNSGKDCLVEAIRRTATTIRRPAPEYGCAAKGSILKIDFFAEGRWGGKAQGMGDYPGNFSWPILRFRVRGSNRPIRKVFLTTEDTESTEKGTERRRINAP